MSRNMFSVLRKVRELSNGRRLHLLHAGRLAWSAAIKSAKDIHLTMNLLPAFDIQRQLATQPLQTANIPRRLVGSSRNHGSAVLVPVGKDHNVLKPETVEASTFLLSVH